MKREKEMICISQSTGDDCHPDGCKMCNYWVEAVPLGDLSGDTPWMGEDEVATCKACDYYKGEWKAPYPCDSNYCKVEVEMEIGLIKSPVHPV